MTNASDSNHAVRADQLRKAREALDLTVAEVAGRMRVDPGILETWEAGVTAPDLEHLERLGEMYGRSIDYFLRETPAPPSEVEFRGKPALTFQRLPLATRVVLAQLDELCRAAAELEELLHVSRKVELSRISGGEGGEADAVRLRKTWHVGMTPLRNLRELLERKGVRVFELPMPEGELSGLSTWHQTYGPCIVANAGDPKGRRSFTLAHELAHLLYGHGTSMCFIPALVVRPHHAAERDANRFAASLLLPREAVEGDLRLSGVPARPSVKQLLPLANRWGVSVQALGIRLEELGVIESGYTQGLVEETPKFRRRPKTPRWERRLGSSMVNAALEAYRKRLITASKLSRVLGVPIRKAMELGSGNSRRA